MDGFDHYADYEYGGNTEAETNGWTGASCDGTRKSDRFTSYQGRAMKGGQGEAHLRKSGLSQTQAVLGWAWKEFDGTYSSYACSFRQATNSICDVTLDTSGYVRILNDSAVVVAGPSTLACALDTWYYFEVVLNVTTGQCRVLVDGVEWLDSGTGNSFGSNIDEFKVQMAQNGWIDDLYLSNSATEILDAPRIITLYPNEQGSQTAWNGTFREVESKGGYTESIDEEYISTDTSTNKESFKYEELPPGSWDVFAVGPVFRAKNNGGGTPTIKISCSTGANQTGISVSNTFTHTKHVENYQTGTTDWTASAVNGLEMTVEYE